MVQSPNPEYQLSLPEYARWVKQLALVAAVIAGIWIVVEVVFNKQYQVLIGLFGYFLVPLIFKKRVGVPLPRKLAIDGNQLIAFDYPRHEMEFAGVDVPINIVPEMKFDLTNTNFEWISGWLVLNNHDNGNSIKICTDGEPEKLKSWLGHHGYQVIGS